MTFACRFLPGWDLLVLELFHTMSGLRFAANLSMLFKECGDLITRFSRAKDAGFNAVECTFPYSETAPAELKSTLEKNWVVSCSGQRVSR